MMDMYSLLMGGGSGGGGGSDSSIIIVHEDENGALDKTWAEIKSAVANGKFVILPYYNDSEGEISYILGYVSGLGTDGETYSITKCYGAEYSPYICADADDYPVYAGD